MLLREFSSHQRFPGFAWPLGPGSGLLMAFEIRSHRHPFSELGYPRLVFWTLIFAFLCLGSLMFSLSPFVHGFPRSLRRAWIVQARSPFVAGSPFQMCVDRRQAAGSLLGEPSRSGFLLVFRVFSSTLLPGFSGPESSVHPWICHPLILPLARVLAHMTACTSDQEGFLGKIHDLPVSRPASRRFDSPRISGLA